MTHFRAMRRYAVDHRVTLITNDSPPREAVLENVGFGGARLLVDRAPAVGTVVRLRINAATAWEPISVDGVIRWSSPRDDGGTHGEGEQTRVGIELAPLSASLALALDAWLENLEFDAPSTRSSAVGHTQRGHGGHGWQA